MNNNNQLFKNYIPIAILGILCLSSMTAFNIVGLVIPFSILYIFIESKKNKKDWKDMGFVLKSIPSDIKKYWWLILTPVVSAIIAISLSKLILPEFYLHVLERSNPMLSFDKIVLLIPQLLIFALGEEIAFRAFFQTKICNIVKPAWAIIIASLFFAIGHFSVGSISMVAYDLIFIFIDSIIYGVIFQKTKNIYCCTISHFLANLIAVYIVLLI